MNTLQSLFINSSIIIAYLCIFSFLLLAFFAINTILWLAIKTAYSEIKLTVINNKHRKEY